MRGKREKEKRREEEEEEEKVVVVVVMMMMMDKRVVWGNVHQPVTVTTRLCYCCSTTYRIVTLLETIVECTE